MKTAIVLGATGMVGKALVSKLLKDTNYGAVKIFVRKSTGINDLKLIEFVVDFDKPDDWASLVTGDVLFSTMGTTLAAAGSKSNQYKVDYTYPYNMAEIASENEVQNYVLVSSTGASASSSNFYLRMKGELDNAVQKLQFQNISILRPGQLYGDRQPQRTTELIAVKIMFGLNKLGLFKKMRPIHASEVASAMIKLANNNFSSIVSLDQLFDI